ncbi:MAG: SRPBCC domain-containing protein [Ilumatobacter sp.]|nr:SRPBCC domain-containing protein [Ilumatobacter sp.]
MSDADTYDWSEFTVTMFYPADLGRVWAAWATPAGLESFFIERCEATALDGRPVPGDEMVTVESTFRWTWRQGIAIDGRFTAAVDRERLGFTFGDMHVEVRFTETADGTRVDLHQTDIADTADGRVWGHLNCRSCWIFFMTNLTSVLTTGTDLRHENPEVTSSMEVGFATATT